MALANQAIKAIKKVLADKRLFYVCRDAERAEAGLYLGLKNFKIITNRSPWSVKLKNKYPGQITEIKEAAVLDTLELLRHPLTKKTAGSRSLMMVFKPTVQIEAVCRENGWTLINPPASLANRVEEKISQIEWLGALKKLLPETKTALVKNINFSGNKFILQFNRAHTGSGTVLIRSARQLKALKKKFPDREARVVKYIDGPMFTVNSAVLKKGVILGNISYQITGLKPFTDRAFATVGNDWLLPAIILSPKERAEILGIAEQIGKKLASGGWRGLYGIDAIIDQKTRRAYLIEINARQPASTSFESYLQIKSGLPGSTIFCAHLAGLLNIKKIGKNIPIADGAQIVQRVTEKITAVPLPRTYKPVPWRSISYNNTKAGSDLLRLQTDHGIMARHGKLNAHGNELSIFTDFALREKIFAEPRAGMIITRDGGKEILLIRRRRNNYAYYVVPGGTPDKNETIPAAAKREIKEETGLSCAPNGKIKPIIFSGTRDEKYFFAGKCSGHPRLGGPEKQRNSRSNFYALAWLPVWKLGRINLLPPVLKQNLIERLGGAKN